MIKVFTTKAFLLFTMIFICIAVFSFVAFRETKADYAEVQKCTQQVPSQKSAEMLWDVFSRRLISLVSI